MEAIEFISNMDQIKWIPMFRQILTRDVIRHHNVTADKSLDVIWWGMMWHGIFYIWTTLHLTFISQKDEDHIF